MSRERAYPIVAEIFPYAREARARDAVGGEDLRQLPLTMRKTNLARLLRGRPDGMFVAPFEAAEIGQDLFAAACRIEPRGPGLEAPRPALWRRPLERPD